jgi:hypothetical protein
MASMATFASIASGGLRCYGVKQQVACTESKVFLELLSTVEAGSLTVRESIAMEALFAICLPIHSFVFPHSLAGMSQEALLQ